MNALEQGVRLAVREGQGGRVVTLYRDARRAQRYDLLVELAEAFPVEVLLTPFHWLTSGHRDYAQGLCEKWDRFTQMVDYRGNYRLELLSIFAELFAMEVKNRPHNTDVVLIWMSWYRDLLAKIRFDTPVNRVALVEHRAHLERMVLLVGRELYRQQGRFVHPHAMRASVSTGIVLLEYQLEQWERLNITRARQV
jgi:hypothetical protein